MSKFDVSSIVQDHYGTLVNARTGRPSVGDYTGMVLVPVAIGVLAWRQSAHLAGVEELLAGVGVFTGGLFALLLQVFQLAERLSSGGRLAGQARLQQLVDELEANASYAVFLGLLSTAVLMTLAAFKAEDDVISSSISGAMFSLLLHWLLSSLMVIKRIRAVYRGLR